MCKCKIGFVLLPIIFGLAFTAHADSQSDRNDADIAQMSVQELMSIDIPTVNGACKFEQRVTDAPSSVTVINAAEIKKYGYRTLADILKAVRGFYVSYDRNYQYLGVRGFSRPGDLNSRVLLLIDGHRINDNIYNTAPIGTELPLDIALIERVEIIRGPSSSLYGTSAFFAVINILTREGKNLKGSEAEVSFATENTYSARLTNGTKLSNGLEYLVSGSRYQSSGQKGLYYSAYDNPATNFGVADHGDDDQNYGVYSKFSFKNWTATGAYLSREKLIPTGSYSVVFNNDQNKSVDAHGYLDVKYEHKLDVSSTLAVKASYDDYLYRGEYIYHVAPGDLLGRNKDSAKGQWVGVEMTYTGRLFEQHMLCLGGEEQYNIRQQQRNYNETPYLVALDDDHTSNRYAVYMQDEYSVLSNLLLTAGIRYDRYSLVGGSVNPRLALIYKPVEKSIFKVLYGSAFRAPNVYEMYYADGATTKGNPDLKPEKIKTAELVYEQYIGEYWRTSIGGFLSRIDDLITQKTDIDGYLVFTNADHVESRGLEAELEGKWPSGFQGRLSYTLQRAVDRETNEVLSNMPPHLMKLNFLVPLYHKDLFAGLDVQYTGPRKTLSGGSAGGYTTVNLSLFSQNIFSGAELTATISNIFNNEYDDPGAGEHLQDVIRQDGRRAGVRFLYRF